MNKKILIACHEVPWHSGASTSSYNLFKTMLADGYDVYYLNIIKQGHDIYYKYVFGSNFGNPKNLQNVNNCVLEDKVFSDTPHYTIINTIKRINPDLILGIQYFTPLLIKQAFPEIPLVYYASGCTQIIELLSRGNYVDTVSVLNALYTQDKNVALHNFREKQSIELSDLVLTHSDMIKNLYDHFYFQYKGKIYDDVIWKAEWIYDDALRYAHHSKSFSDREIDFVFVASIWNRIEKNQDLLNLLLHKLEGFEIHVIGDADSKLNFVKYHNIIADRNKLFSILGNSKTLICPSSYDPAPGVLFEASALGANIVASKNCGNWQICNSNLLVENYNAEEFIRKAKLCLNKKYKDNIEYFFNTKSYKSLIDILSVFN